MDEDVESEIEEWKGVLMTVEDADGGEVECEWEEAETNVSNNQSRNFGTEEEAEN